MKLFIKLLVASLVVAGLTGCGGSSSPVEQPTPTPTSTPTPTPTPEPTPVPPSTDAETILPPR